MARALKLVIDTVSRELRGRGFADADTYVWCLQLFPSLFVYDNLSYAADWRCQNGRFDIPAADLPDDVRKKAVNAWRRKASGYLGDDVRGQRKAFEKAAEFIDPTNSALLNRVDYSEAVARMAHDYLLGTGTRGSGIFGNKNLPWANVADFLDACLGEKNARSQFGDALISALGDDFNAYADEFGGPGMLDAALDGTLQTYRALSDELDRVVPGQPDWRGPARLLTFAILSAIYGPHDYTRLFGIMPTMAIGETVNPKDPWGLFAACAPDPAPTQASVVVTVIEYAAGSGLGSYRTAYRPIVLTRGHELAIQRGQGVRVSDDGRATTLGIEDPDACVSRQGAVRLSVDSRGRCQMRVGNSFGVAVFSGGAGAGTFYRRDEVAVLDNGDIVALTPYYDEATKSYHPRAGKLAFRIERG